MRKLPNEFYRRLKTLRDEYGQREYDRDDLRDEVVELLKVFVPPADNELYKDAADEKLNSAEKAEDNPEQPGLFPYDAHVALGEKKRIKRSRMNFEQHLRRKRVIDANKAAQDLGWAIETGWLNAGVDALQGFPSTVVREDMLNEDGSSRPPKAA
jgi:hypothetical protein